MMRILLGTALVTAVFAFSPYRPAVGIADDMAALAKTASTQLATSATASGLPPALTDAVLRRTITDAIPELSGVTTGARQDGQPARR